MKFNCIASVLAIGFTMIFSQVKSADAPFLVNSNINLSEPRKGDLCIEDKNTKQSVLFAPSDCFSPYPGWYVSPYVNNKTELSAFQSLTITENTRYNFRAGGSRWPSSIVDLAVNEEKNVQFLLRKDEIQENLCCSTGRLTVINGPYFEGTDERSENYVIEKYTANLSNTQSVMGKHHWFSHTLKFDAEGIYMVRFETYVSFGDYCGRTSKCRYGKKGDSYYDRYNYLIIRVTDPLKTPSTSTIAPVIQSIYCNNVVVRATIPKVANDEKFKYYFVNGCQGSRVPATSIRRGTTEHTVYGNITSSGIWHLRAYNPCNGKWGGCGPGTAITVPFVSAPILYNGQTSAKKYEICEGESITLSAGTYADYFKWYQVSYDSKGNLVLGKELSSGNSSDGKNQYFTFKASGLYTARAYKTFTDHNGNPLLCQSLTSASFVVEIKVHPYSPSAAFNVNGTKHYTQVPVTLQFTTKMDPRINYFGGWSFEVDWGDGHVEPLLLSRESGNGAWVLKDISHAYTTPGQYTIRSMIQAPMSCPSYHDQQISIFRTLCITTLPLLSTNDSRNIQKNTINGKFALTNQCVGSYAIGCLSGLPEQQIPTLAVKASATKISDRWNVINSSVGSATTVRPNVFETGGRGKWRMQENYVYNTHLQPSEINKEAGRFNLVYFDWQTNLVVSDQGGWLKTNTINKYTPDGVPVEEINALNIESAAKLGYNNSVPYLVAQNASFGAVYFESFEKNYPGSTIAYHFEERYAVPFSGAVLSSIGEAHSGQYSLQLKSSTLRLQEISGIKPDQSILIKFWVKNEQSLTGETINNLTVSLISNISEEAFIFPLRERIVAKVGEWQLFEAVFKPTNTSIPQTYTPVIHHNSTSSIWIDDVRIQPQEAQLIAYVYDPYTLRLIATFDDQHFGLYHQYDEEGRLVRKLVETERGIKTLQEQHTNIPRPEPSPIKGSQ